MLTRVILIVLTVIVYTVAWYGDLLSGSEHHRHEYGTPVVVQSTGAEAGYSVDLYEEGFINTAKPNTVSHVSAVVPLSEGRIMAAWYEGTKEGAKDVSVETAVYSPKTHKWSETQAVVTRTSSSKELGRYIKKLGNPVLFTDSKGRLWLVYVSVSVGGWSGSSLNYKMSLDEGRSWSKSKKLITSPLFNISTLVKNKPVQLDNGTLLLPTYHELLNKSPELLFITPGDEGLSIRSKRVVMHNGALQGALFVTANGTLRAFYRNATGAEHTYVLSSLSTDNGRSWSSPKETGLPNPNSGLDVVSAGGGRALMVLNDTFTNRTRLSLYLSVDSGDTWKRIKVLEEGDGREFSYPYIIRTDDGFYHITYTYDRERIKQVRFSEAWLKGASNG